VLLEERGDVGRVHELLRDERADEVALRRLGLRERLGRQLPLLDEEPAEPQLRRLGEHVLDPALPERERELLPLGTEHQPARRLRRRGQVEEPQRALLREVPLDGEPAASAASAVTLRSAMP